MCIVYFVLLDLKFSISHVYAFCILYLQKGGMRLVLTNSSEQVTALKESHGLALMQQMLEATRAMHFRLGFHFQPFQVQL